MVATPECPATCFDTLLRHFKVDDQFDVKRMVPSGEYPLFVTWKKKSLIDDNYTLRGCIGTFSPIELQKGLEEYSLTSALSDKRFNPIRSDEISALQCGISVLSHFETAHHVYDWQIGTHGIMIEFTDPFSYTFRKATYLPEICKEQNWNHHECIQSLIRKSGFSGYISDSLRSRLRVTRYQSSKALLTYEQYQALTDCSDACGL